MAELNVSHHRVTRASVQLAVPEELSERFHPDETANFEVVREAGTVRLWRTTTWAQRAHMSTGTDKAHYHITRGERAEILFVGDLACATPNFEAIAAQQV